MGKLKSNNIAIIVPAFNEAKTIRALLKSILQYASQVIVINDASTDKTVEEIADLPITILHNSKNLGKGASMLKGFKHAKILGAKAVITIDADGQHNPSDIPRFIQATQQSPNQVIIGSRLQNRENAPKLRRTANDIADFFISWAAGCKIIDTQSGYRLYPFAALNKTINRKIKKEKFTFESELLIDITRKGYTPATIRIRSLYPKDARPSHYKPFRDTCDIILMVTWKIVSRGLCFPGLWRTLSNKGMTLDT